MVSVHIPCICFDADPWHVVLCIHYNYITGADQEDLHLVEEGM
jgi:hypothetical protein